MGPAAQYSFTSASTQLGGLLSDRRTVANRVESMRMTSVQYRRGDDWVAHANLQDNHCNSPCFQSELTVRCARKAHTTCVRCERTRTPCNQGRQGVPTNVQTVPEPPLMQFSSVFCARAQLE